MQNENLAAEHPSCIDTPDHLISAPRRKYPSKLFVETTTRCNLKCQMCVKHSGDSDIPEGDLTMETFKALEPALGQAEALILNGIGEPLMHPQLEEFIRRAKELMPANGWVGFQSNGLLLDEERALSLVEAGLDRICLSLDAICPDTFRKIREGGEVDDLEQAFSALKTARAENGDSPLKIGVEFVVMRDNLYQLPTVIRWAASRGASFAIVSHLLPYAQNHVSQVAYDSNSDESIVLFESWKNRAKTEGIDMSDYFYVYFCKYVRTEEEQRMVDFVHEMMAEARSRDIFLHVQNLLKRDLSLAEEVNRVFAEARNVALETGIELKLPAVAPQSDRRCDFVEGGGAFISWDGSVHPCYFLWHKFACYFSGRKKFIIPKVYGNLSDRGIREIWNDQGFRSFRDEVMLHEYPFCSNCNLIPCEYIYTEEFEQDCYTNTVPCGDCFWCMGLFQCLQ
ncbi:MAG: radical SAM/SPASM domain-containing protein [Deltaproteobacteria bacterium]